MMQVSLKNMGKRKTSKVTQNYVLRRMKFYKN